MTSDDSDKTVFKPAISDDFGATSMRPTPGGLRGKGAIGTARSSSTRGAAPIQSQSAVKEIPIDLDAMPVGHGLNPLVEAASALLAVFEKTRSSVHHPDVPGLHSRLITEIKAFENRLRDQGTAPEIVLSARYVMCSVLDETILNTPWGSDSPWAQRTLLSIFHNETSGGEKFFLILDRIRKAPADNLNMIELMYICLSLGFEGKYRLDARGRDTIELIRDDLFAIILVFEATTIESWRTAGRVWGISGKLWQIIFPCGSLFLLSLRCYFSATPGFAGIYLKHRNLSITSLTK